MGRRFPPDLLAVVVGPFVVIAIALAFGSFIFHVERLRGTATGYILAAAVLVCLLTALVIHIRRR
jgi:hypothetical protein